MYDAWGERAEGSHWEDTGNQWWCKSGRGMVSATLDLWTWRKLEPPHKTQWLVGEGSSGDAGKYKLWIYRILNGSNIDWEVDKCMDPFIGLISFFLINILLGFTLYFKIIVTITTYTPLWFHVVNSCFTSHCSCLSCENHVSPKCFFFMSC